MRTNKSLLNFITSFSSQFILILLGFLSRRVLIYSVGVEYLGINGLMTNILTVFSLAESGIGLAIGYSLYEPLANRDCEKIKSLMYFYKKTYELLAFGTLIIGLLFYPYLHLFIKGSTTGKINIIYFLFLFSSIASYLFSYKVTLNNSDQNNYLYTIANTISQIIVLIIKVIVLYYTENYILFLSIDIFTNITKNILFSFIVDKKYPYLKEKNVVKLDEKTKSSLFKNIKALFIGKIGYIVSQCSDNLVISSLISISSLGMYDNYNTLINSLSGFVRTFTTSITASMGNLLVLEDKEKSYNIFEKISFINGWLYTFCSVCLFCLMESFVELWLGREFILNRDILIVALLLFYFKGINLSIDMVKTAAGLYYPDRYIPILEAICNLVISIVLATHIGLIGVLLGTLISFLMFSFWIKPFLVYKYVFNKRFIDYIELQVSEIIVGIINVIITFIVVNMISVNNIYISFILKTIICCFVSNTMLIIFKYKNSNFKFVFNALKHRILGD